MAPVADSSKHLASTFSCQRSDQVISFKGSWKVAASLCLVASHYNPLVSPLSFLLPITDLAAKCTSGFLFWIKCIWEVLWFLLLHGHKTEAKVGCMPSETGVAGQSPLYHHIKNRWVAEECSCSIPAGSYMPIHLISNNGIWFSHTAPKNCKVGLGHVFLPA